MIRKPPAIVGRNNLNV